ncbi:hypothetical protein HUJ04_000130 [Dendroctonus ponderosae]|nr:hypothetical protein HUJ04_000130 [Dendroctonus ponderosae]
MSPMGASEAEMGGPSALAGSLAGGALILVASRSRSWPFPSAVLVGCLFACRSSSQSVAQQAAICLSRLERFFWSGSGQSRRAPQWALPSRPGKAPTMTDREDSMDDDVFEAVEARLEVPEDGQRGTHSPTGYRGYQPSIDVINLCNQLEDAEVPVHKTILLGDSGVGKTSLLVKFDTGKFESSKFSATVGIGFTTKVVQVDDSKVKLQIWDTAGQERFRCVTHAYYRDAHDKDSLAAVDWSFCTTRQYRGRSERTGVSLALFAALLLLYDVTNKKSFDNIRAWLGEIKDYAHDDVVIMLLGNKADCGSDRAIKREEGERLAREYRVTFMETSAKSGQNVELAFHAIARDLTSRSAANADPQRFNVQDYVRAQAQHGPESPHREMAQLVERRIRLRSINNHIACKICKGYLIDATTVTECLHTFCKSCLVKHLEENNTCPICSIVIHQSHPLQYISFDRTMQDIVYKLVPNLMEVELSREREFYRVRGLPNPKDIPLQNLDLNSEDLQHDPHAASDYHRQDEQVNVCLECISANLRALKRRYIRCSAQATILHLKKFIAMKILNGMDQYREIDILCNEELLGKDHTLKFVVVTRWRFQNAPLTLQFFESLAELGRFAAGGNSVVATPPTTPLCGAVGVQEGAGGANHTTFTPKWVLEGRSPLTGRNCQSSPALLSRSAPELPPLRPDGAAKCFLPNCSLIEVLAGAGAVSGAPWGPDLCPVTVFPRAKPWGARFARNSRAEQLDSLHDPLPTPIRSSAVSGHLLVKCSRTEATGYQDGMVEAFWGPGLTLRHFALRQLSKENMRPVQ